jgi:RHS repeat-associated protein
MLLFLTVLIGGSAARAQAIPGNNRISPTATPAPTKFNDAVFSSQSVPTTMVANEVYNVSVTMRNTGSETWTEAGNYRLGSLSPRDNYTWGIQRVSMGSSVVENWQLKTFNFQVTAPSTPGTYTFHWGMVQEWVEWFGTTSPVTVTVTAPAPVNNAAIVSVSAASQMVSGQAYTVSVIMRNTGTTTWSPGTYRLGSQNPGDNYTWMSGTNRVNLASAVAPGQQYQFTFQVVAPAPGSYSMQWRMVQEYVEWFGGTSSTPVTVVSATPKPTISVSRPAPVAGQSFTTSWSTTNATSLTHVCTASGTGYKADESLAVNGSRTLVAQSGWVGYPSTCTWTASGVGGSATFSETMTTSAAATPAPTVSVKRNPSTMTAGQAYTLSWSTTNASSLTRVCSASGTGYKVNESLPTSGSNSGTASTAWVDYPSTCTWTATGGGGSAQYVETMTTAAAASSGVTYIHTDGLGSPVARTDASGNVISRTRYEPYGYVASGAAPTIGFTGHVNDGDTGLTYMQQRYYDPVAGRFLSIDPVVTDANTGTSFNRYVYASNSPYKYIDPDGRQSLVNNMPVYSPKVQVEIAVRVFYGQLFEKTKAIATAASVALGAPEAVAAKEVVVTAESIRAALKGSEMLTTQESVSLPMVKEYVGKFLNGEVAPAISVDGKIIVEGNHRYIAARVAGKEVATKEGTAAMSQVAKAKPIENIKISEKDFRNP